VTPGRIVTGTLRLSPMIVGYKLGVVPATSMRAAIVRAAFRGRGQQEVSAAKPEPGRGHFLTFDSRGSK